MQDTNMTNPTSPFAPVDIPDINNVPASGAMPPMGAVPSADSYNIPMPAQPQMAAQPMQGATGVEMADVGNTTTPNPVAPAGEVSMSDIPEPKLAPEVPVEQPEEKAPVIPNQVPKTAPVKRALGAQKSPETVKKPVAAPVKAAQQVEKQVDQKAAAQDTKVNMAPAAAVVEAMASVSGNTSGVSIEALLEECIRHNASDLHLQVNLPPILRVDGALQPMTSYPVLTNEMVEQLVFSTLDANQKMILIKDKEFDYSFAFGDLGRFRVNAFHEKGNMAAAFRLIPNVIKNIDDLGIPGVVATFTDHPNGLVLVTGPTGSGKSTTLAALVDKINTEKSEHIITIEDPIEFTHTSKRSVVAQREVHYDTFSFAAALRSILREDPDVVLIGEMRDLETIQAAITVAETGHLVFATLHTNSAAQSIDRMIDVFPAHQQPQVRAQLANILVGICSQRLVPAIDGGRVAVTEIMVTNSAVRSIIREGKTHQLDMTIQTGMSQGMQTMDRELAKYVKTGVIAYDVAKAYAVDPIEFDRLARG